MLPRRRIPNDSLVLQNLSAVEPSPTFLGCCTPYPDARFVDMELVSVHMHHRGKHCGGYMEPLSLALWYVGVRTYVP